MKLQITNLIPEQVKNALRKFIDIRELRKLPDTSVNVNDLIEIKDATIFETIFNSPEYFKKWDSVKGELESLNLPNDTGGVNTGDQRAIAYLIWHFKPIRILEIGTHIGCSTVHLSVAQRELNRQELIKNIVTVDIRDVNDVQKKPWLEYKSQMSPLELLRQVGCENNVEFCCQPSVEYLTNCKDKFDFIFLDGGHSASLVYQELPLAIQLLNKNGLVLLHDYFPSNKPMWSNNVVIPGPYLATQRLIQNGIQIKILPLGKLPWQTKHGSNYTSLAVCSRA
jgi:predicted O-methyltransferase YrrM